jgi:hypothetical protein
MTKVNSLEDKIKEYLDKPNWYKDRNDTASVAHDIALICKIEDQYNYCDLVLKNDELEKENAELKDQLYKRNKRIEVLEQQLDNVKFLDRDTVEKYLQKECFKNYDGSWNEPDPQDLEELIKYVLSLAFPVIDKERVNPIGSDIESWDNPNQYVINLLKEEILRLNDKDRHLWTEVELRVFDIQILKLQRAIKILEVVQRLAEPIIDKDRIIKVLEKNSENIYVQIGYKTVVVQDKFEVIANEILNIKE